MAKDTPKTTVKVNPNADTRPGDPVNVAPKVKPNPDGTLEERMAAMAQDQERSRKQ